jgi:signal transduction histidine kinase
MFAAAKTMSTQTLQSSQIDARQRIEELGRIIMAYSAVTEKLEQSHDRLEQMVTNLRAELSEKNRLLERRNRLAALGEMAAGMAHEIRNPLGGIQLYASMLAADMADRPASLTVVRKISQGVVRLEGLVSQVLQFTREIRANIGTMDLSQTVLQAVEYAALRLGKRQIECHRRGPVLLEIQADSNLIEQAILNLVLNAADATPEHGTVIIEFRAPVDEQEARQFILSVEDTGPGVPSDMMDKIFNPFFTTKDDGTGLGLAIVHRIVEAHDGTIIVKNIPAGGARFEIRI